MGKGFTSVVWPPYVHGEAFPVNAAFQCTIHRIQKIIAVELRVKTHQIGAQHSIQEFPLPGADAEGLGVGPWDVPEQRNSRIGTKFFDHPGQQGEVIILNQDTRFLHAIQFLALRFRRICDWPPDTGPNPRRETRAAYGQYGKEAKSPRWKTRNNSRSPLPW